MFIFDFKRVLVLLCFGVVSFFFIWAAWARNLSIFFLSTPGGLTGDLNIAIPSTVNLSRWLALDSRVCIKNESRTVTFRYMEVKLVCQNTTEVCTVWYWDVANWTIIYTNENLFQAARVNSTTRFCPMPLRGERTDRIIRPDGKVEYNYCPDDRFPCAPKNLLEAHWDKTLKIRINSSPCCRKQNIDVMKYAGLMFDKHNITYMHVGGTVIGLVRDHGQFIPYDYDTDFAVDSNDYEKLVKAIPDLQKTGYVFKFTHPERDPPNSGKHWYMVGCINKHCGCGPGIGIYRTDSEWIVAPGTWKYPKNIMLPPIRRIFEGMEMSFPREPEKYLDYVYGKDKWRTPFKYGDSRK